MNTTLREEWYKQTTAYGRPAEEVLVKIADWWLAKLESQRTADLEAIREWALDNESTLKGFDLDGCIELSGLLSLIEQIMNKKIEEHG